MGSGDHVVVDISSDEEVDTLADKSYYNWLSDVLEAVDEKSDSGDEVEVISEVKGCIARKLNSSSKAVVDEYDDDCVVLDGDPDKTTKFASAVDDEKLTKNDDDDDDDDDVLVVGQKGEIACRDFPHPRHSCAKYSFDSTSHENYCDMCHCYVCDIPAPCPYWCIGVSTVDHCHANDKEMIWKNQREYFRTGVMPTESSPKPTTIHLTTSSTVTRQCSRSPIQNIVQLSQSTLPRNQVGIRPCSSTTRAANISLNARGRHRTKQSVRHVQESQNRAVQSLSIRNNVIQKDRSPCTINLRSRVASSVTRFGGTYGKSKKMGLCSNDQVSQTIHPSCSSIVAPTINLGMYTQQQCSYQSSASRFCTATPPGQNNTSGSQNRQFQTITADLFARPPEAPLTAAAAAAAVGAGSSQAETVQQQQQQQQQVGTNGNVLQRKLSEVESFLMDQTGLFPEQIGQDCAGSLTFDFETFFK